MTRTVTLAVLITLLVSVTNAQSRFAIKKKINLGGEGGWDYLTYDAPRQRLFITRGTHVIVVDAATGKPIGDIPDTPGVHGVALAPDLSKGFISAGRASKVVVFDMKSLKAISAVPVGDGPDAITFEPVSNRVFTFNAHSHDTTAIDAKTERVVGSIPLGGKPEFAVPDGTGKLFVNIENTGEIAEIDAVNLRVLSRWKMQDCEEPTGLAFDKADSLLFSGCSNKVLKVVSAKDGKTVATVPIGDGVDGVGFDDGLHYAFSSNGEGTLTIIGQKDGKWQDLSTLPTQRGARTLAINTTGHRVYTVTAVAEEKDGHRSYVPNTFVLLEIDQE